MVMVKTRVNVDAEVEVNVSLADALAEFIQTCNEFEDADAPAPMRSVVLPAVDIATRLLAAIPDEALKRFTPVNIEEIVKRLEVQLERYKTFRRVEHAQD